MPMLLQLVVKNVASYPPGTAQIPAGTLEFERI
jgi:hypothetical protein